VSIGVKLGLAKVASRLAQLLAAPPGLPSFGGLAVSAPGAAAAQAFLSAEVVSSEDVCFLLIMLI